MLQRQSTALTKKAQGEQYLWQSCQTEMPDYKAFLFDSGKDPQRETDTGRGGWVGTECAEMDTGRGGWVGWYGVRLVYGTLLGRTL